MWVRKGQDLGETRTEESFLSVYNQYPHGRGWGGGEDGGVGVEG